MTKLTIKNYQLDLAKKTILNNLKIVHQSKPVNFCCVISGITNNNIAFKAFDELLSTGFIRVDQIPVKDKFNRQGLYANFYRYNKLDH